MRGQRQQGGAALGRLLDVGRAAARLDTFRRELFQTTKDNECSKYTRLSYNTPRIYDPKRVNPWLTDVTHTGLSSNKKRAVEAAIHRPDFLQWSVYPLNKPSNYQSTQGYASLNSHNLGKILKEEVDHVCDSEIVVSAPISNFLSKADDGRLLRSFGCNKYYSSFLSLGSPCQIKDGNNTPVDGIHNERLDLNLTLGRNYEKKRDKIVTGRAEEGPSEHAFGMAVADKKAIADSKAILDYSNYAHFSGATSQTNTVEPTAHQNNIPVDVICNSRQNGHRTLGCNDKEKGNFVVSGGVKATANDEAKLNNQNSAQSSRATIQGGIVEPNAHPSSESNSNPGDNVKETKAHNKKKPKAASDPRPNLYPSSVLSLLSTGIFDGALVKYICESRDLILHGVIKGPKIRCSCDECHNSEYIGLCKFELHAGGKSKRPTSHIFLENGKTLYDVFHELKDASEDKLFDAIQQIAGSAVNQPNFRIWKGRPNFGLLPSAPSPK
ncbi:uncharacterized protein LOC115726631 [Rhodamnia argentea]|uniref:Uncharacterized protein LOC115726631 n=1 Tax=Rhodamnia argentea TaxID=178133 RepID=A0ABM3HUJ4_9MYRT|nr:uncharacterized protein LOC115726631 [Rhodamnia argentea]